MSAQIQSLFPTPIVSNKFTESFTKKEKEFIQSHADKVIKTDSYLNNISKDKYVLEYKEMSRIKKFIEENINYYLKNVVCADDKVSLRITQSWINYTEPDKSHHRHSHPNSYISGVFYFNADKEYDRIYFIREVYRQLLINPQEFNLWNSTSWWLPVGTGDLLIFPSDLLHMVDNTVTKDTRISIAFNTFPVGLIGSDIDATSLHLQG